MKKVLFTTIALVTAIGLAIPMAIPVVAATLIYVNASTGNDAWDGQAAVWDGTHGPKATIAAGIGVVGSSGTVYVAAGTYYEHLTIGKALTLQGEDRDTTVIDGGGSGSVLHLTSSYVTVSGFTVTNGDYGIYSPSSYHVIEDCVISNNGVIALTANPFSNSVVRNCEVSGNDWGLDVSWGSNVVLTNNEVHHNTYTGINLDSMSYTIVEKNIVYLNHTGINIGYAGRYNTIRDNIVYYNEHGIYMSPESWAGNNEVYHNDLIDNTEQGHDDEHVDIWDDGYPYGGNYWSDYTGVDDYSGPGQNVAGSDGIGDTPYWVDLIAKDNYPLMTPWAGVTIDIKPGSDPNSINLRSKGVIPVAILTTPDFDAATVDASTVMFGPDAAIMVHNRAHFEDVDGDGDIDMVLHFKTRETGIAPGYTSAMLVGWTYADGPIIGVNSVKTVPTK